MDDEWNRFRPKIRRKPMQMRWAMRVAAIFLGVVFVGGITVRIIDKWLDEPTTTIAKVQDAPKNADRKMAAEDIKSNESPKKEDSRSLITEKNAASSISHASITKTTKTKQTEESEAEDMDIDEYLRLQQARIDNDLAMMTAESYLYEYDEFLQDLEGIGAYDTTELATAIRQVTIQ